MKMDRQAGLAAIDVEKYSKIGVKELQQSRLDSAIDAFEYAFRKSQFIKDPSTERGCAFNLGAGYVAAGQPDKGIEILKLAQPPPDTRDSRSNGDLYFNFALAYEALRNYNEAIKYYELSKSEYVLERDNPEVEAEALEKLAKLYTLTGQRHFAADAYKQISIMYELMGKKCKQAASLFELSNKFLVTREFHESESLADECMKVLSSCPDDQKIGNTYNDVGLLFTQLQCYEKAGTCFEQALPIIRAKNDGRQEAVILQNLGAIYNFLGDYQRAVKFHEDAAIKYAELQNRKSQGQCFANLAFAFSQLNDIESAGEAYLHSLQAASDTGDKRTMWQVLEGLGAIAFHQKNINKSVKYYKQALGILAGGGEDNLAQERIVGKLTHVLQLKLSKSNYVTDKNKTKASPQTSPVRVAPNRPKSAVQKVADLPTGEEIIQVGARLLKVRRSSSKMRFKKFARGLDVGIETPIPGEQHNHSPQASFNKSVTSQSIAEESDSGSESDSESGSCSETDSGSSDSESSHGEKSQRSKEKPKRKVAQQMPVDSQKQQPKIRTSMMRPVSAKFRTRDDPSLKKFSAPKPLLELRDPGDDGVEKLRQLLERKEKEEEEAGPSGTKPAGQKSGKMKSDDSSLESVVVGSDSGSESGRASGMESVVVGSESESETDTGSGSYSSSESSYTDDSSSSDPGYEKVKDKNPDLPTKSPPATLNKSGTYEEPAPPGKMAGILRHRTKESLGTSGYYAEIDFGPEPGTSLSQENMENTYETINPMDMDHQSLSALPRGQSEQILSMAYQQKMPAVSETDETKDSKTCIVM